jgi:hypothetical protein
MKYSEERRKDAGRALQTVTASGGLYASLQEFSVKVEPAPDGVFSSQIVEAN